MSRTGEPVALKVLDLADSSAVRAARAEAALLSALDHPHLIQLRETIPDGQSIVLALELAVGGSLAELLSRRGRLSPGEVVGAISPIAAALAYVHDQGVVHSDVAPANILFRADGSPVLADLGVARLLGAVDPPRSTLAYVDPEVAAGGIPSPASDVFMAAATALHALTGMPPWPGATAEVVLAQACAGQIEGLAESLAALPRPVADVIRRGLSLSSAARGTAAEFALDLRHAASPVPIDLGAGRPREPHISTPSDRPIGRNGPGSIRPGPIRPASITPRAAAARSAGHQPRHAVPATSVSSRKPDSHVRLERPAFARSGSWHPDLGRPTFVPPDSQTSDPGSGGLRSEGSDAHSPPLALTHIVRARIRSPEPAPSLGLWRRRPVRAPLRMPLVLATVVLLAVCGLAWLRWGPAWPRAATAAPVGSAGSPARTSGSVEIAPSSAADPPLSAGPTTWSAPSTRRTGATTAPAATRSTVKSTGSLPSERAPVGEARWSTVLGELDRHRQTAFATDDPAPLATVYVPGTLLRQDVAALRQVVGPGCRLIGLRTRYKVVHVSTTVNRSVVLSTRASLDSASLQCPGSPARMLPAHRAVSMTVVLVPNGSTYLIGGIDVSL